MRFLCLVHFDGAVLAGLSPADAVTLDKQSLGYDGEITRSGHYIASQALQSPATGKIVRVRNGAVSATDGPFTEAREQLGGFILIEAADMDEAVRIAAGIPLAKLGAIEVRPIYDIPVHEA